MQLKNDGFDWIRKKKKLRTFYEMILQGKKIPADKTERNKKEHPIIYPKDCYPRDKILGEWITGKVQVSKEQWDLIIREIRCWIPDNIHLEMNLGTHFEINDEYQAKRKKEDDKFLDNYIPSHLK